MPFSLVGLYILPRFLSDNLGEFVSSILRNLIGNSFVSDRDFILPVIFVTVIGPLCCIRSGWSHSNPRKAMIILTGFSSVSTEKPIVKCKKIYLFWGFITSLLYFMLYWSLFTMSPHMWLILQTSIVCPRRRLLPSFALSSPSPLWSVMR